MLSKRQESLFAELGLDPDDETQVRAINKDCYPTKPFTTYLRERLQRKWARERQQTRAVYLGD